MDHLLIIVAAVAALAFSSKVHAISPHELMTKAMRDGKAHGVLTGSMADQLKAATHSTADTIAKIERVETMANRCEVYTFTVTQPQIPDRSGKIVGDYVTVTRSKFCPNDRKNQYKPEVIACSIGGVSCMPGSRVVPQR